LVGLACRVIRLLDTKVWFNNEFTPHEHFRTAVRKDHVVSFNSGRLIVHDPADNFVKSCSSGARCTASWSILEKTTRT
jgi:hypothetical protein